MYWREMSSGATAKQGNEIVRVEAAAGGYDIHIGTGLLDMAPALLPWSLANRAVFILTDENAALPHAARLYEALKEARPDSLQMLALPSGEQTKSFGMLEKVLGWLLDHGVDRSSVLFTVGGGVVGDLGGLAASLVMRGIDFVQVPTTLLAQVDSAVGGKTGINVAQGKNLVGTFHQPAAVLSDIETLKTLPRREILAGYAEIAKYGFIGDREFFLWLEKEHENICALQREPLINVIAMSCRKKAEIVKADERERKDTRAPLNFGHTFGHALEAAAGYNGRLLHGEAVAIGMALAFRLSVRLGFCGEQEASRAEDHLKAVGLPTAANMIFPPVETDSGKLIEYMKRDKKASAGEVKFILAHAVGDAFVGHGIDMEQVRGLLTDSLKGN
jgi:3-dehydroquinate synthase